MQAVLESPEMTSTKTIQKIIELTEIESAFAFVSEVSWETFNAILTKRDGRRSPRFFYHQGQLLIMPTYLQHENIAYFLELFVTFVTIEWRLKCAAFGSATFLRETIAEGFEPDACFYFNDNAARMRGRDKFEQDDPAPDLIIEVDITSPSNIREKTFAAFGVPEIWRFKDKQMQIAQLDNGSYVAAANSLFLPAVTPNILLEFVIARNTLELYEWQEKAREWARQNK